MRRKHQLAGLASKSEFCPRLLSISAALCFTIMCFGDDSFAANVCLPSDGPSSQMGVLDEIGRHLAPQEPSANATALASSVDPAESQKIRALYAAWRDFSLSGTGISDDSRSKLQEAFKSSSVDFSNSFQLYSASLAKIDPSEDLPRLVADILAHYGRWRGISDDSSSKELPAIVEDPEIRKRLEIDPSDKRPLSSILLDILERSSETPEEADRLFTQREAIKSLGGEIRAYQLRLKVVLGDELFKRWEKEAYRVSEKIPEQVPRFSEIAFFQRQIKRLSSDGARVDVVLETFKWKLNDLMRQANGAFELSMINLAIQFDEKDVERVRQITWADDEIQRVSAATKELPRSSSLISGYRFGVSVQDQYLERLSYLSLFAGRMSSQDYRFFEQMTLAWQADEFKRSGVELPPVIVTAGASNEELVRLAREDQIGIDLGNGQMVSLRDLIEKAQLYNEQGFVEAGEQAKKTTRWNDPLLERFRDRSNDYTDVPQEAYEKAQLVLSILSRSFGKPVTKIPLRYANLLLWSRQELAYTAFIRSFIPDAIIGELKEPSDEESQAPLSLTGELKRPDVALLQEQAQSLDNFYAHLSQVIGHDKVRIQFKNFTEFEQYQEQLMPLFERKSLMVPGPGLIQMGCMGSAQKTGELQSEASWSLGEAMSESRFNEILNDRTGFRNIATESSFVVRDQNLLMRLFSQCLDQMAKKKRDLESELTTSWEKAFQELKADRARDLAVVLSALDQALQNETVKLPEIRGSSDEVMNESMKKIEEISAKRGNSILRKLGDILREFPAEPQLQAARKLAEARFNRADLESIVKMGPQNFLELFQPPLRAHVVQGLERLSLLELDSLANLVKRFGWKAKPFDPEVAGQRELRDWFIEFLPRGTDLQLSSESVLQMASGRLQLLPEESAALQASSQELMDAGNLVPLVWGANWKTSTDENLFELRKRLNLDLWRIMDFLMERQQLALELSPRTVNGRQFQPAKGLQSIQDLKLGDVEQLRRYGVPVDNVEVMTRLFDLSAKLIWKRIEQNYVESLKTSGKTAAEIAEIKKDLARTDLDGPHPNVVLYQTRKTNKERQEQSAFYSEKLELPPQIKDDDQRSFAARVAEGLNQFTQQYVLSGLRSSNAFVLDLLSEADQEGAHKLSGSMKALAEKGLSAESRQKKFLEFMGLDTNSEEFRKALKLLRSALAGKDTNAFTDFEKEMDLEIQSFAKGVQDLTASFDRTPHGLSRKDFRDLLFQVQKDPVFRDFVIGRDSSTGELKEGFEVKELATPILRFLGESYLRKDQKIVREQLSAFRRILRGTQLLFPEMDHSFAHSLAMQMPTVLFESLPDRQKDREIVRELLGKEYDTYSRALPLEAQSLLLRTMKTPVSISAILENRFQALDEFLKLTTAGQASGLSEELQRDLVLQLSRANSTNETQLDEIFVYLNLMLENRARWFDGISKAEESAIQERAMTIEQKIRDLIPPGLRNQSEVSFSKLFEALRKPQTLPDNLDVNKWSSLRQRATGFKEGQSLEFVSIFDELKMAQKAKEERVERLISSRLDSILLDKSGELGISARNIQLFPEAFAAANKETDEKKKEQLQLAGALKARNQIWEFLDKQDNSFFSTSRRSESIAAIARKIFPKDYDVMLIQGQAEPLHKAIDALLSQMNESRIELVALEGPALSREHLMKLREWAQNEFVDALNAASDDDRPDLLKAGWMPFLADENLEKFLKVELNLKDPQIYLNSSSFQRQLDRLVGDGFAFDILLNQAGRSVVSMSRSAESALWSKTSASMMERLSQVSEFGLSSSEMIKGISRLNANRTAGLTEQIKTDRYGSESKDSWSLWALHGTKGFFGEIGYLLWEGGKEAVAGMGRMVGENVVVNLPWALASMSDAILQTEIADDVFDDTTKFMGRYSWSNFHKDKLSASRGEIAGNLAADFVGNTLTVMSFGGWSAVRGVGSQLGKTTLVTSGRGALESIKSAAIRRAPGLVGSMERAGATAGRILTREIGGLSQAARAELALQRSLQRASAEMAQKSVRPSLGSRLASSGRSLQAQSKALGARLVIDNAVLAGGGAAVQLALFGDPGLDQFGQSFGHGMAFMSTLIASSFLLRGLPLTNKTVHVALQSYIFRDFAKSSTIVMNNWINPPEYMKYLSDDEFGDNGLPVPGAFDDAPDPEAAAEAYMNDQMVKYQAASGALLIGLIAGSHASKYVVDPMAARSIAKRVSAGEKPSAILETLRGAYGSNPKAVYQELERIEIQRIKDENIAARVEAQKKGDPIPAELTDVQVKEAASQLAQRKYYDFWLAAHPEQAFIRQIAFWEANGRLTDLQKSQMRSLLIDSYKKIYGENVPLESKARTLGSRGVAEDSIPRLDLQELLKVFDESWNKGIQLGQELKLIHAAQIQQSNPAEVAKSLSYTFELLRRKLEKGEEISPQMLKEALNEVAPADFWDSTAGQFVISQVVLPKMRALREGSKSVEIFGSPIGEATPSGLRIAEIWESLDVSRKDGSAPSVGVSTRLTERPEVQNLMVFPKLGTSEFSGMTYEINGKRYAEVNRFGSGQETQVGRGLVIELPEGISMGFLQNGQPYVMARGEIYRIQDMPGLFKIGERYNLMIEQRGTDTMSHYLGSRLRATRTASNEGTAPAGGALIQVRSGNEWKNADDTSVFFTGVNPETSVVQVKTVDASGKESTRSITVEEVVSAGTIRLLKAPADNVVSSVSRRIRGQDTVEVPVLSVRWRQVPDAQTGTRSNLPSAEFVSLPDGSSMIRLQNQGAKGLPSEIWLPRGFTVIEGGPHRVVLSDSLGFKYELDFASNQWKTFGEQGRPLKDFDVDLVRSKKDRKALAVGDEKVTRPPTIAEFVQQISNSAGLSPAELLMTSGLLAVHRAGNFNSKFDSVKERVSENEVQEAIQTLAPRENAQSVKDVDPQQVQRKAESLRASSRASREEVERFLRETERQNPALQMLDPKHRSTEDLIQGIDSDQLLRFVTQEALGNLRGDIPQAIRSITQKDFKSWTSDEAFEMNRFLSEISKQDWARIFKRDQLELAYRASARGRKIESLQRTVKDFATALLQQSAREKLGLQESDGPIRVKERAENLVEKSLHEFGESILRGELSRDEVENLSSLIPRASLEAAIDLGYLTRKEKIHLGASKISPEAWKLSEVPEAEVQKLTAQDFATGLKNLSYADLVLFAAQSNRIDNAFIQQHLTLGKIKALMAERNFQFKRDRLEVLMTEIDSIEGAMNIAMGR